MKNHPLQYFLAIKDLLVMKTPYSSSTAQLKVTTISVKKRKSTTKSKAKPKSEVVSTKHTLKGTYNAVYTSKSITTKSHAYLYLLLGKIMH